MKRLLGWLSLGVLIACAWAPTTDRLRVTGNLNGDSLHVFTAWHTSGPVDSVTVMLTSARTSPTAIYRGPGAQNAAVDLNVVPVLQPGDTVRMSSCIATKQLGTWTNFGGCKSVLYTQAGGAVDTVTAQ